jgi:tetratricopeptide (TPR) repeat protein
MDREALRQLAAREFRAGRLAESAELFGQAARDDAKGAEDYCNRGMILTRLGKTDEAIAALKKALAIRPEFFEAFYNLGIAYREQDRPADAIDVYRRALALQPGNDIIRNNLGNALCVVGRYEESIEQLRAAIATRPDNADYHYNLGIALQLAGKEDDARDSFGRAIELNPGLIEGYTNLGSLLLSQGKLDESAEVFRRALAHDSAAAMIHWNLSQVLLLQGDYEQGWREYDWRRRVPEFEPFTAEFTQPMWDGGDLRGRTVLLYGEQGFGDSIHFARYAPLVSQRGGKAVMACQPKVLRLMKTLPGIEKFVSPLDKLPDFDVHCPLPSLPLVLKMPTPEDYQWTGAYLKSDGVLRRQFEDAIAQAGKKLKVGLVWCGRTKPAGRSIPLAMLGALADPSVLFYSLQIGEGSNETAAPGMNLINLTDRITDFADTAALIDQMDLVIGIDTAVAQLAGALGKPVWTMLKRVPDWRWQTSGDRTPWYPTMRLFRQKAFGEWGPVIQEVAAALRSRLAAL